MAEAYSISIHCKSGTLLCVVSVDVSVDLCFVQSRGVDLGFAG